VEKIKSPGDSSAEPAFFFSLKNRGNFRISDKNQIGGIFRNPETGDPP
jgi:hypothetical protein